MKKADIAINFSERNNKLRTVFISGIDKDSKRIKKLTGRDYSCLIIPPVTRKENTFDTLWGILSYLK